MMNKECLGLLLILFVINSAYTQGKKFSKLEIKEDLFELESQLIKHHPNIYVYTDSSSFHRFFDEIKIDDVLSEEQAYSVIASCNTVIRDGHSLMYPSSETLKRNNELGAFLPLQPFWDGSKLYILKDYSQSKSIEPGAEIVSINGVESAQLITSMLDRMMKDGNNDNYAIWVLNCFFYEYYSYFYGCKSKYELVLKKDGEEVMIKVDGIKKPLLFQRMAEWNKPDKSNLAVDNGVFLTIDVDSKTGILVIRDWHKDNLRIRYKQRFMPVIKKVIKQIEEHKLENLIIDIRGNQGGNTKYSEYLLSYLLDEPFVMIEQFYKKKKGVMIPQNGRRLGLHKSLSNTFGGRIFVLIDGGSFSNSGIFASVLKKYDRAIFIGEETGGSEFILASNPKKLKLTNSGIIIDLPRLQYLIKSHKNEILHGVIPNYEIKPSIENLIAKEDVIMLFARELITANL